MDINVEQLLNNGWATLLFQIGAIVILFSILHYILSVILRRMEKKRAKHSKSRALIISVIRTIRFPIYATIWVGGLGVIIRTINTLYPLSLFESILSFRSALFVIIAAWALLRINKAYIANLRKKAVAEGRDNATLILFLEKGISISILIVSALTAMQTFGFNINGILAFGGVGGIIVGMAAKDMLANLFGSIMIHFDRPFTVGEWVSIPEKSIEGTVERIGWRQTIIRTFAKRLIYVPNSLFGNMVIENPDRMTHRRFLEVIGLRYEDQSKLEAIIPAIKQFALDHPDTDNVLGVDVHFINFNNYSLDIRISAYTQKTGFIDFLNMKQDLLYGIGKIVEEHGADFAFPTQTLHMHQEEAHA